jgi:hypothetical protein
MNERLARGETPSIVLMRRGSEVKESSPGGGDFNRVLGRCESERDKTRQLRERPVLVG